MFDPEPMVTSEALFRRFSEDKYFSKIDLSKGYYWQIPVAENDIHKTAFLAPDGTYEFLKMPFGMNSAAALMRATRKLLAGLDNVDSYVDDILTHTGTWEEHLLQALRELFSRMLKWGITARPSKCVFGEEAVDFIGHKIGRGELGLHHGNVKES